ncbi:MAG: hypothetical protein ACRDA8_19375 [Shewanella sp.]
MIGFLHPDSAARVGNINGAFSHSGIICSFKCGDYTIFAKVNLIKAKSNKKAKANKKARGFGLLAFAGQIMGRQRLLDLVE